MSSDMWWLVVLVMVSVTVAAWERSRGAPWRAILPGVSLLFGMSLYFGARVLLPSGLALPIGLGAILASGVVTVASARHRLRSSVLLHHLPEASEWRGQPELLIQLTDERDSVLAARRRTASLVKFLPAIAIGAGSAVTGSWVLALGAVVSMLITWMRLKSHWDIRDTPLRDG